MSDSSAPPGVEWFGRMADACGQVFFVLRVQPDYAFEFLSGPGDRRSADAAELFGAVDPAHRDRLAAALALPPGGDTEVELRWRTADGARIYSRIWLRSVRRADGSVALEGVARDVTALHEAERERQISQERYRLLVENAWEVIWTMALDGTITYVSPAVERVRGITPDEAKHQSLEEIHPPESAASVQAYYTELFAAIAAGTELPTFRGEHEYYRKDGSIMTGELQVIPHLSPDGEVVEILGVTRDVSERKQFEAELRRLAAIDTVTGAWNRRYGEERISAELARAQDDGRPLTLLMLDIDRFKKINDTYGHHTGDRVLIEVVRRLRDSLRSTDIAARWGGEEFVVLLRNTDLDDAVTTAEKIRGQISDVIFDDVGVVTISIGAAGLRRDDTLDSWLARADEALYRAKRSGRNAVRS